MIDILFFPDYEMGHILPSFRMAHNLEAEGYKVGYLCIADLQKVIEKEGFKTFVIFEDLYPKGALKKSSLDKIEALEKNVEPSDERQEHRLHLLTGKLDDLILQLKPRLLITSYFISFEALIMHYKYKLDQIIYHPALPALQLLEEKPDILLEELTRLTCLEELGMLSGELMGPFLRFLRKAGVRISKMKDVVKPIEKMPQILVCPKELDIKDRPSYSNEIIMGPGIRNQTNESIEEYLAPASGRKMIYASVGSQVSNYPEKARKLFELLIECMRQEALQDYYLLLSIGALEQSSFSNLPSNVGLFNWIPLVDILQHLSLAIIHGGLGTTKECVYFGVPMLVVPMALDQFDNGKRIEHKQLGLQLNIDNLQLDELSEKIDFILKSKEIKIAGNKMQQLFIAAEEKQVEVSFISSFIGTPALAE